MAALTGPLRRGGLAVLALAVVALPWLAVKYAPVAVAARPPRALAAVAGGPPRGSPRWPGGGSRGGGRLLVLVHEALYGGTTPYAAGSYFVNGQLR